MTDRPSPIVSCEWCGESVVGVPLVDRRYVQLEPHEDIYPTRACEGGNRVFDTLLNQFLPRGLERERRATGRVMADQRRIAERQGVY